MLIIRRSYDAYRVPQGRCGKNIRDAAVIELYSRGVLEEVFPPRFHGGDAGGYDVTVHQRPGIVGETRFQPCHQGTGSELDKYDCEDSPAGRYLIELGVQPVDFNQYGTRRGNDQAGINRMAHQAIRSALH